MKRSSLNKIVLNIPHASVEGLYDKKLSFWQPTVSFINDCVYKLTDWHTDYLFVEDSSTITPIRFPYSRFIVDAERLENDPLESIGQGIIYKQFDSFSRNIPNDKTTIDRLKALWDNHQKNLTNKLDEDAILIDCHSFPQEMSDIDVCIGYNDDWSKPNQLILDKVQQIFIDAGYKIGINNPYSNSISPKREFKYSSFMLEINKAAYMSGNISDGATLSKTKAPKLAQTIRKVYKELLK